LACGVVEVGDAVVELDPVPAVVAQPAGERAGDPYDRRSFVDKSDESRHTHAAMTSMTDTSATAGMFVVVISILPL
jgi:hypothetical protein